jgi:hypothetical protein
MILWFLNIRHSSTLFGMWFLTSAHQMFLPSYPLKPKYVELMGKGKCYNSCYVYNQAKGWSKRVKKTFSMILERVFEMV